MTTVGADEWLHRLSNTAGTADVTYDYGYTTDVPLFGDWLGKGTLDPGVARRDNGQWEWLLRDTDNGGTADTTFTYGTDDSIPVVGDWDGNGTFTPGIIVKDGNQWEFELRNENSSGPADITVIYGSNNQDQIPVVGDWDGTGTFTPGVVQDNGGRGNSCFATRTMVGRPTTTTPTGPPTEFANLGGLEWQRLIHARSDARRRRPVGISTPRVKHFRVVRISSSHWECTTPTLQSPARVSTSCGHGQSLVCHHFVAAVRNGGDGLQLS